MRILVVVLALIAQAATPIFRFETDGFWLNLHHYLYVLGRAEAELPDSRREAVRLGAQVVAILGILGGFLTPILLSTGLTNIDDVKRACSVVESAWKRHTVAPGMVLLHCVSAYPTPDSAENLRAIDTLPRRWGSRLNSALRSGSSEPPCPVPLGSPVWAMKPGITRWNTTLL